MTLASRLLRLIGGPAWASGGSREQGRRGGAKAALPAFTPTEFLGRPATACRFAEQPAVIGYVDRDGQPSTRAVTFDELFDQNDRRYLGGYCRERFERRHFRLDRITFMRRIVSGEHVDPAREVLRWIGRA